MFKAIGRWAGRQGREGGRRSGIWADGAVDGLACGGWEDGQIGWMNGRTCWCATGQAGR